MSADIKPGDLVMVVRPRPCCGVASRMGMVGIAEIAKPIGDQVWCENCSMVDKNWANYFFIAPHGYCHKSRLKKIDPPALADEVERVRELAAV